MNPTGTASTALPVGLPSSYSRYMGEDFAPPRSLYLIHFPAIMVVTGLTTWIIGTEEAMVVAAGVAGAIALYLMWDWLFRVGPTRFSTLLSMTLLLGYGLGTLNTWLTLPRAYLSLSNFLGLDEGVLARAMAAVLLASAPLCFFGELLERPLFGREFRIPLDQRTYLVIVLGTLGVVAGFFTHTLDYMGVGYANGQLNIAAALLSWLFSPLTAVTMAVFLVTTGRIAKLVTGACTLVLCICLVAIGRRVMIYTAMEVFFALRLTGYRLQGSFFKKALLILAAVAFLAVGITAFMLLRIAGYEVHHTANVSLAQRINIALNWVEDGTALKRATEANQTNIQSRTFVLGFFSDVLEGSSRHTPGLGRDVAGYISLSIPRVLNPDKDLTFGEEGLDDELFGLTWKDGANSILTNGATDFGLLGVIAYPLLLVWFLRACIDFLSRLLPPISMSIMALGTIFCLLQTENALVSYFSAIRDGIVIAIALFLLARLPDFRWQNL